MNKKSPAETSDRFLDFRSGKIIFRAVFDAT